MWVPFGAKLFCTRVLGTILYLEGYRAESLGPSCSALRIWELSYALKGTEQNLWTLLAECGQVHSCTHLRPGDQRPGSGAPWAERAM